MEAGNHLGVPAGQSGTLGYDDAGNVTTDTYGADAVTRLYDANNRMTKETQANNYIAGEYSYDADGRRVKRKADGVETWQVYGVGGELLAEYPVNGPASAPQKEYAYRSGALIVTATGAVSWGSPPVLHDNPLVVGVTTVQSRHITELRDAINAVRTHMQMSAYSWQYAAVAVGDLIKADPILEMRTALDEALGAPSPAYSSGLATSQPVKAVHIQELRDRVLGAWSNGGTELRWFVADHLGTPRMIFDQSGSLDHTSRHDYLPFGEELTAAGRNSDEGYGKPDGNARQKFTSKERDDETKLDYFFARYYSPDHGRFTSPDKPFADQFQANPQSWNTYSYVRNRPCNNVDAKGRCSAPSGLKPGQTGICIEAFIAKTFFKGVGLGDSRTFSGDNPKLTAKFKTHIIVDPAGGNGSKANVAQTTEAGVSQVITFSPTLPIIAAKGTAETSLNGGQAGSDTQTSVAVDKEGVARFNVSSSARHGFSALKDDGTISASVNFEVNTKTNDVSMDAGSELTGYPSFGIYSYENVNGKIVTTKIWEQSEGSPDALKQPRKPIPDQTQKK